MLLGFAATALAAGVCLAQEAGSSTGVARDALAPEHVVSNANAIPLVPPSALAQGANSFTEAQARARLEDAGLAGISELHQDGSGIWRGSALRDGAPVSIGFDFKGDIAAQ